MNLDEKQQFARACHDVASKPSKPSRVVRWNQLTHAERSFAVRFALEARKRTLLERAAQAVQQQREIESLKMDRENERRRARLVAEQHLQAIDELTSELAELRAQLGVTSNG